MHRWIYRLAAIVSATWACSPPMNAFVHDGGDVVSADGASCHSNSDCDDHVACTHDLCLVGGVCNHQQDSTLCPAGQTCNATGCGSGTRTCHAVTDCDDHIACTRDTCLVDMTCQSRPDDTLCPVGMSCDAVHGCTTMPSHCSTNTDCNDMIDCTQDTCGVDGTCAHTAQNNRCATGLTCSPMLGCVMAAPCGSNAQCDDHVYCNGTETCNTELACVSGTAVNCDDMNACTVDTCNETTHACDHMMNPTCMGMMGQSGIYDITPMVNYSCDCDMASSSYDLCRLVVPVGPLVSVSASTLTFTVTATNTTVTGTPADMMGPAPSAMMFTVSGTRAGDCTETYGLTGTFTDSTHFTGTLTIMFSGSSCSISDCTNQSFPVSGTRRP